MKGENRLILFSQKWKNRQDMAKSLIFNYFALLFNSLIRYEIQNQKDYHKFLFITIIIIWSGNYFQGNLHSQITMLARLSSVGSQRILNPLKNLLKFYENIH